MTKSFDIRRQCCYCGADNSKEPKGYAGERTCSACGWGGYGDPEWPVMAYKAGAEGRNAE